MHFWTKNRKKKLNGNTLIEFLFSPDFSTHLPRIGPPPPKAIDELPQETFIPHRELPFFPTGCFVNYMGDLATKNSGHEVTLACYKHYPVNEGLIVPLLCVGTDDSTY